MRDDVDQAIVDAIALRHKKMASRAPPIPANAETFTPKNDAENLKAFMAALAPSFAKPGQTEIQVHAATTEEIIEYKKDSVGYKEFSGGAKRIAPKVLRPGVTFYEIEYVEPGKEAGMKYHLFYWDGNQWSMLGAAWRELPAE